MKIISGKYKGRNLKGFDIIGTRPTMDRVKESLFAMIQDHVKDSIVLDLYAGTGNLGIEAISNGASYTYFVDNNKIAIKTINDNVNMLNIYNAKIINGDANNTLCNFIKEGLTFDIIFLDPPYHTKEIENILNVINDNIKILSDNSIIVCETEIKINYEKYNNLEIYKNRCYGSKMVTILKKK